MADKTIKLNLNVDSKTGEASIKRVEKATKSFSKSTTRGVDGITKSFDKSSKSIKKFGAISKTSFALAAAGIAGLSYGAIKLSKSFLNAATVSEGFRVRLNTLLGSVEEGGRAFREMSKFAAEVPYRYEEIMRATTALSGVMSGGVDEIKRWMPMITDLAAVSGLALEEATGQIIRMYSAGAASADMFRERGILAMMGFKAGVSYTAEETRKMMFKSWNSQESKFKGVTKELAKTWEGTMSMIGDKWFQLRNIVMEAGVYDALKTGLEEVNKSLGEWIKNNKELIELTVKKWVDDVKDAIVLLKDNVDLLVVAMKVLGGLVAVMLAGATINAIKSIGAAFLWVGGGILTATTVLLGFFKYTKAAAGLAGIVTKGWEKFRVVMNLLARNTGIFGKIIFTALSLAATKLAALSVSAVAVGVSMAAAGGYWIGVWLNSFNSVKKAAKHTWNGIFFAAKYSILKIQLSFLQEIETIKTGWKNLKKWFIDTFPKMAQYMDMEMPIIKDTPKIIALKNEIVALKEEYKLLEAAINKAYAEVPTLPTIPVTAEEVVGVDVDKDKGVPDKKKDFLDYDAEFKIFEQQLVTMSKGIEKFDSDRAVRTRKAAQEAAERRAADHAEVLQYISTEEENSLRAINTERDAMLERTTTLEEYIAVMERSAELKGELAEKTETQKNAISEWASTAITLTEQWEATAIHAAESFSSGITDAFFEFAEGTKSAEDAFREFASNFLKQIAKMIMQQLILNTLKSVAGAYFSDGGVVEGGEQTALAKGGILSQGKMMEYAKGAAFNNGMKMHAFATGGVVSQPTVFPMANGMGLMGEAGPEAIMPLKRGKNGKLGVEGGGGNTINTTINITTGGQGEDPEESKRRGREMARVVEAEFNRNLTKQMRPGGLLNQQ